MQDNTIKVVTPKDADDILGVITQDMDEGKYVHQLERLYGFPCIVRMMIFADSPFPFNERGKE